MTRSARRQRWVRVGARCAAFAVALSSAVVAQAGPPAPGTCPQLSRPARVGRGEQTPAAPLLQEGQVLAMSDLLHARATAPARELWRNRETFFYEGMRLEIGGCHRRYPASPVLRRGDRETSRARRTLDEDGNLRDYVAGLPFPRRVDRHAGARRRRDAGRGTSSSAIAARARSGSFRILDLPSRHRHAPRPTRASFFFLRTAHRADLAESDYAAPTRRQERVGRRRALRRAVRRAPPRLAPVPPRGGRAALRGARRHLRLRARRCGRCGARRRAWVDGLYTPRYRVAGDDAAAAAFPSARASTGPAGSIQPTAGALDRGDREPAARLRRPRAAPERLRLARARRARGAGAAERARAGLPG